MDRDLGAAQSLLHRRKKSEEGKIEPCPCKGCLSPRDERLCQLRRKNNTEHDIFKINSFIFTGTAMKYFFVRDHRGVFPGPYLGYLSPGEYEKKNVA